MLKGIPVSPGIAIGKAFMYDKEDFWVEERTVSPKEVEGEVKRFLDALEETVQELGDTRRKVEAELGKEHALIFEAHLMMLEDHTFIEQIVSCIRDEHKNAEYAFFRALRKVIKVLSTSGDRYLRERASDFLDIESRVLVKLCGQERSTLDSLRSDVIVVAHDLSPSDTVHMHRDHVLGFVTDVGGSTSHAAIIARALEIPAVVGAETAYTEIDAGDTVIVDGNHGRVYINPDEKTLTDYRLEKRRLLELEKDLTAFRDLPAVTLDGAMVEVSANIELPEEVESAVAHGAQGIGLYRTEFLYLAQQKLPTEEEQLEAYRRIAERITPYPVTIRTLDLGGDKLSHSLSALPEMNPFLGWRSIRICLEHKDLFRTQLRAILRASLTGNVRIMFPMISGIEELIQAKEILGDTKAELKREDIPFDENCEVGAMIEVPSAAVMADQLAEEVDFFSIGTNDLVQYSVAVDRASERVAYLFDPLHPGVLRLIKSVIDAGHEKGIPVAMCGEMSGDPLATIVLLGLGLNEFSMSPIVIPGIKKIIRSVSLNEAEMIAREAMSLRTRKEIRTMLRSVLDEKLGDLPFISAEPGIA